MKSATLILLFTVLLCAQATQSNRGAQEEIKRQGKIAAAERKEEAKRIKAEREQLDRLPLEALFAEPPERIKPAIIRLTQPWRYSIDSDTQYQLVLVHVMTGRESIGPLIALGNSRADDPVKTMRFIFTPERGQTRVSASGDISVRLPLGRVNRHAIDGNKEWRTDIQTLFRVVRAMLAER